MILMAAHCKLPFRGVRGHFEGSNPWMPMEDSVIPGSAKLVGAKTDEVTVMNSLTVNLHLGLVSSALLVGLSIIHMVLRCLFIGLCPTGTRFSWKRTHFLQIWLAVMCVELIGEALFLQYAVQSQVRWHGYDPNSAVVFAKPYKVIVVRLC